MVFLKNVEVGVLRVNSGTGGAIGHDSALLEDIRLALQGRDTVTVVQAIQQQTTQVLNSIAGLSRQIGGIPGGGAAGGGGAPSGTGPDHDAPGSPLRKIQEHMDEILVKLERAIVMFEDTGKDGGKGGNSYFQREIQMSAVGHINALGEQMRVGGFRIRNVLDSVQDLIQNQFKANISSLGAGLLSTVLHFTNLNSAVRQLHQGIMQNVQGYKTDVFGSNVLTTGEYFLEFYNRVSKGILMETDSFRTGLKTVQDAFQHDLMTPMAATGRALPELTHDFELARQGIKGHGGPDLYAYGGVSETERWLSNMADTLQKYGQRALIHDPITETAIASQTTFLAKISANTGISVDKLETLVKRAADQNATWVGMGRLNATEGRNYSQAEGAIKGTYGKDADILFELQRKVLAGGRPDQGPEQILAHDPEFWSKFNLAAPGALEQVMRIMRMEMGGTNIEGLQPEIARLGLMIRDFQEQSRNQGTVMSKALGDGIVNQLGALGVLTNRAFTKPNADAEQQAREAPDAGAAMVNKTISLWDQQIKPAFMGLDASILKLIIAIGANTFAMYMVASKIGIGAAGGALAGAGTAAAAGGGALTGIMRGLSRAVPFAGAAATAGIEYAQGAPTDKIAVTSGASLAGGIAGSLIGGPVGAAIGAGLTGYLADYLYEHMGSSAVPVPQNQAGPSAAGPTVTDDRTVSYQDSSLGLLSTMVNQSGETSQTLIQIHGELQRQTNYLMGDSSSPIASVQGLGLRAPGVRTRSMLGRADDGSPSNMS